MTHVSKTTPFVVCGEHSVFLLAPTSETGLHSSPLHAKWCSSGAHTIARVNNAAVAPAKGENQNRNLSSGAHRVMARVDDAAVAPAKGHHAFARRLVALRDAG